MISPQGEGYRQEITENRMEYLPDLRPGQVTKACSSVFCLQMHV